MKLREKIHSYLQKRALDKAFDNFFKKFDTYDCDYFTDEDYDERFDDKRLHIIIVPKIGHEAFKKEKEKVEFNLPSLEEIISEAKKIYKKLDDSNLEKILYHFSYFGNLERFNKIVVINANGSNLRFQDCVFKSIKIDNANNVSFCECEALNDIEIKALKIELSLTTLVGRNIILNVKEIITYNSHRRVISGQKIVLDGENVDIKNIKLKATEAVIINNKSCNKISIESPKIIYNGKEISNNDEIVMQKLRQRLIEDLKEIKNNVNNNLESYVANEKFVKIMKKS